MCQTCIEFASSGRKNRRCEGSKSNSPTSRARKANNINFARELAADVARRHGRELGMEVLKASPTDMPVIVNALGRDPETFDNEMPGTSANLKDLDHSSGEALAKQIEEAKKKQADEDARAAAAEESARQAAEAAAAEQRRVEAEKIAADNAELEELSEATGMTPEQIAEARLANEQARDSEDAEFAKAKQTISDRRERSERAAELAYDKGRDRVAARHEATIAALNAEEDQLDAAHSERLGELDAEQSRINGEVPSETTSERGVDDAGREGTWEQPSPDGPKVFIADEDVYDDTEGPTDDEVDERLVEEARPVPADSLLGDRGAQSFNNANETLDRIEAGDYPRKKDGELSQKSLRDMDKDLAAAKESAETTLNPDHWETRSKLDRLDDDERTERESAMRDARESLLRKASGIEDARDGFDPGTVEPLRGYLGIPEGQKITSHDLDSDKVAKGLAADERTRLSTGDLLTGDAAKDPAAAIDSALAGPTPEVSKAIDAGQKRISERSRGRIGNSRNNSVLSGEPSSDREALEDAKGFFEHNSSRDTNFDDDDRREALSTVPSAYLAEMKVRDTDHNRADNEEAGRTRLPASFIADSGELSGALSGKTGDARNVALESYVEDSGSPHIPERMRGGDERDFRGVVVGHTAADATPTDVELGQIIHSTQDEVMESLQDFDPEYTDLEDGFDDADERDKYLQGAAAYRVSTREEFARRAEAAVDDRSKWPELVDFAESVSNRGSLGGVEELNSQLITPELDGQESLFNI